MIYGGRVAEDVDPYDICVHTVGAIHESPVISKTKRANTVRPYG